jgi:lipopolysaccharide export LptBFGC system permease protein LptF
MIAGAKIMDRYIGRQILLAAGMGVLVLSLVFVLGNLFKEIFELLVDKDLPLDSVLKFIAYILPFSLIFTIPWGFLTAVLLVFGRLSADNELISMRMSGMSMLRICASVFILATGLAGVSLWINTKVAPKAQAEMKQAMYAMVINDPLALFVPDQTLTDFDPYVIYVKEREGTRLRHVEIEQLDEFKRPMRYLRAREAELEYSAENDSLEMKLIGMENIDVGKFVKPGADGMVEVAPGASAEISNVSLDLSKLRESANKLSDSSLPTRDLRKRLKNEPDMSKSDRSKVLTEINKRYSFSLACITFALIGVPLGVTAQRRETSVGFAISLVIAIVYFLFIILADTMRDDPSKYPHLLMWLPNVLFMSIGVYLFVKMSRR